MANITITAIKNDDTTASISSLLASFSHHALYDMPFGKLYEFANSTNFA
jgi:hypothetical protein